MSGDKSAGPGRGDYEVGFGRPPSASKWKPGQSGNPRGRRKKSKRDHDFDKLLRRLLTDKVKIVENGREISVSVLEVIAKVTVQDLVKGPPTVRFKLIKELRELGLLQPSSEDQRMDENSIRAVVEELARFASELGDD
jgi:hypothetical protein